MTEDREYKMWFTDLGSRPDRKKTQFYVLYDWPKDVKVCGPYTFSEAVPIRLYLNGEIYTRDELLDPEGEFTEVAYTEALKAWEASGDADQRRIEGGAG